MRTGALVVVLALAGCAPPPPDVPMPTAGPNQVVLKVPDMS